mmetsp:Transcript_119629/g.332711  ORF Transcript_119629/g.332711 Transcript_119629/m.332711 type:complete len:265 (+) Transcript_119629:88-882(+)
MRDTRPTVEPSLQDVRARRSGPSVRRALFQGATFSRQTTHRWQARCSPVQRDAHRNMAGMQTTCLSARTGGHHTSHKCGMATNSTGQRRTNFWSSPEQKDLQTLPGRVPRPSRRLPHVSCTTSPMRNSATDGLSACGCSARSRPRSSSRGRTADPRRPRSRRGRSACRPRSCSRSPNACTPGGSRTSSRTPPRLPPSCPLCPSRRTPNRRTCTRCSPHRAPRSRPPCTLASSAGASSSGRLSSSSSAQSWSALLSLAPPSMRRS